MKIETIMTKEVITVEMDDNLEIVKDIFDNAKIHHLLVVEDGQLVGVLSDRDLYQAISPNIGTSRFTYWDLETLKKRVHTIMTRNPITLSRNGSLMDAVRIFNANQFSCIPVVDENNYVEGILTWRDIMKKLPDLFPAT
jgi:acetoin utilization protein AcuB